MKRKSLKIGDLPALIADIEAKNRVHKNYQGYERYETHEDTKFNDGLDAAIAVIRAAIDKEGK